MTGSDDVLRCTVTIGVSPPFHGVHELEDALRQADVALYRGKTAGRNRIESADVFANTPLDDRETAIA